MPVSAKSRFEEGLNLPPIKIGENFEIRNDFLEFYSVYGLRAPAMFISDLRARCTTADRVRVRVLELVEKRGPDFVVGLMRKMCETAEAGALKKIKALPDGKFRAVVFNDAIGWTPALVRACYLTLTEKTARASPSISTAPRRKIHPPTTSIRKPSSATSPISCTNTFFTTCPSPAPRLRAIDFQFPEGHHSQPRQNGRHQLLRLHRHASRCATHNAFAKMIFSNADLWRQVAAAPGSQHTSQICAGHSQWNLAVSDVLSFSLNTQGQGGRSGARWHGRLRFRLVRLWPRARFRASRKRTARHRHALAALERFQRPRTAIAAVPAACSNG